jgi:hypothetical protein
MIRGTLASLALPLLLAGAVFAQAPTAVIKVDPAGPVKPGTFVTLDATASDGDAIDWDTDVPETAWRADSNGKVLYFVAPAGGVYPFKLQSLKIVDGKIRIAKAKVSIPAEGSGPAPPDNPTPPDGVTPKPDPKPPTPTPNPIPVAPVTGKIYATLFYSLAEPAKGAAAIRQAGLQTKLMLDDCVWAAWPDTAVKVNPDGSVHPTTVVVEGNYQPSIDAAGGLPAVVFQDSTGKILAAIRAGSADEIAAKVKAFRQGVK